MKVMVLGSGAREHAIGWALARSPGASLLFAPGNAGTRSIGENLADLDPRDCEAVAAAAARRGVELVVVGPEEPLERGIADRLHAAGVPVFGPSRAAARLETSKAFSKSFMRRHGVPTAPGLTFADFDSFRRHVESAPLPLVAKKSGLAAGKGVLVSDEVGAILEFGRGVLASDTVLVEERLEGFELSAFVIMDGEGYRVLPTCADHKKAFDGDRGPNTGGMGAVCPVPAVDAALLGRIVEETVEPTVRGLRAEGLMYRGVLFLGLMVTPAGCKVLEYNVRFGDPETQVLLPAVDVDWLALLGAAASARFGDLTLPPPARTCVGVVVASGGYPDAYPKGMAARVLPEAARDALVFHASTTMGSDGIVRTGGGRCFTVVGSGADVREARARAYAALGAVRFDGAWSRLDIGVNYVS
jgi:phosphoribosylamine---glycine ligase